MTTRKLQIAALQIDDSPQTRAGLNLETVATYAAAMRDGETFQPVVVFQDVERLLLADGFHRVAGAEENGQAEIMADVRQGTAADALRYALGANARHGLPRTNADKRHSVELALAKWPNVSDRELAKICAVSPTFVGTVRDQLSTVDSCQPATVAGCEPATRLGADGKERRLPAKRTLPPPPPMQPRTEPEPEPEEEAEPPRVTAHTPPPPPAKVFTDETGWPVPTHLIPLYREGPEAQELLSAISKVRGALRTAQEQKRKLFLEVGFTRALCGLDSAYDEIKRAKPYAVCPSCKGQVMDRCLFCHGRGLISEFTWNTVASREAKEFRFKMLGMKKGGE
jgi:hypothetical protein